MDIGTPQEPNLLRRLAETMDHGRGNVMRRVDARELVRVGKEVALERLGLRINVA